MIVVKVGGRVIKAGIDNILADLLSINDKIVFVHGGGDIVTEYSKKMGIEPTFVTSPEGIRSRYTTKEELDVYVMVMSWINKRIVVELNSRGKRAIGLSGADGLLMLASRKKRIMIIDERGKKRIIDGGYTGKITAVNKEVIQELFKSFDVIVVSPIAMDPEERTLLNVDGDQTAFSISVALSADYLILLTDVEGVIFNNTVVPSLKPQEAKELSSKIGPGMNRKLLMAAEAVNNGVKRVVISSGLLEKPVTNALNSKGTIITNI
ncbi:MAG: [LysW]-aminoadipate/[LysW]-glutamate kinase [Sulfolobaceae archaeon]|nr:[LysW]-aminoadipate/[LysW]-glutamate kinase [Sulfolobaceae archaeon]